MHYVTGILAFAAATALAAPARHLEARRKPDYQIGSFPTDCQNVWKGYLSVSAAGQDAGLSWNSKKWLSYQGASSGVYAEFWACNPNYGPQSGSAGYQYGFVYVPETQQCLQKTKNNYAILGKCSPKTNKGKFARSQTWLLLNAEDDQQLYWGGETCDSGYWGWQLSQEAWTEGALQFGCGGQSISFEQTFTQGAQVTSDGGAGTTDDGTGVEDDGTGENGGTTDDNTDDNTDDGTADDGTADDGTTDDGTTDNGTTDDGTTDGNTDDNADDNTDDGAGATTDDNTDDNTDGNADDNADDNTDGTGDDNVDDGTAEDGNTDDNADDNTGDDNGDDNGDAGTADDDGAADV